MSIPSRVPSDTVKAVFHYLGEKNRFPADIPKIHQFFYKISLIKEYRSLFSGFTFDPAKSYPHSTTISFALDRLQKSKLLSCINPSLDQFEVTTNLALDTETEDSFNEKERQKLQRCAKLFMKEVTNAERG